MKTKVYIVKVTDVKANLSVLRSFEHDEFLTFFRPEERDRLKDGNEVYWTTGVPGKQTYEYTGKLVDVVEVGE